MTVRERWTTQLKKNVARHRPRRNIFEFRFPSIGGLWEFGSTALTLYQFRLRREHEIDVWELSMMERVASGNVSGGLA